MTNKSISLWSIRKLSETIKNGGLSSIELVEICLKKINELNSTLNSFITVTNERAYEEAEIAEKEIKKGINRSALQGIPFSIKDIICTKGVRCTAGSKIRSDRISKIDATIVARMKKAGAILIGTNNLNEFASGITGINPHYGDSKNPWNIHHLSGGSSGGSAVGVATGMVPLSLGTDTGGSIRVPSSLCGVVGLKPTFGRVSKYGVLPLAPSLDHIGCITRSAWDAALVLKIIAGIDPRDPFTENVNVPEYTRIIADRTEEKMSIALPKTYFFDYLQTEVKSIIDDFIDTIGLSNNVFETKIEKTDKIYKSWLSIRLAEAAEIHLKWLKSEPDYYTQEVRKMLVEGTLIPATEYIRAYKIRDEIRYEFLKLLRKVDVIIVPTTIISAPSFCDKEVINIDGKVMEIRKALLRNTIVFNTIGLPAVSIPIGLTKRRMPVGVQIVGRPFEEEKVLSIAYKYELFNNSLEKYIPPLH